MMNPKNSRSIYLIAFFVLFFFNAYGQTARPVLEAQGKAKTRTVLVGKAWAKNSVNAVANRRNALATFKGYQYIAFYDSLQRVVLGKRKQGSSKWMLHVTQYKGKATDAHNIISLAVDGDGYLHVSWDHHVNRLRYCKSLRPESLQLSEMKSMTGQNEDKVTYPEFYSLPDGNLFFFYRDGSSGDGNMIMNYYDVKIGKWTSRQRGWISGQGERNAYWQIAIDRKGVIHVAWVWRETGNVATNHDICYARSKDRGITWEKSTGERYNLPITQANAEYVYRIPQNSDLINPPAITADQNGRPYIASYWRGENNVPQYYVLYQGAAGWERQQVSNRTSKFSLSGGGTRRIPISRPCLLARTRSGKQQVFLVFRDEERGSKASVFICNDLRKKVWEVKDLNSDDLRAWEPNCDWALWDKKQKISLFIQKVEQGNAETLKEIPAQPVYVLDWKP